MANYGQQPHVPPPHPGAAYYPGWAPEPPKPLTTLAVLAFAAAAVATLFDVGTALLVGRVIRDVNAEPDPGTVPWTEVAYALGSSLELLALVGGWITAALWLYRARTNAEKMAPGATFVRSAGWAWGGWVCPFVSLWFPFQVVRDTRRAVAPLRDAALIGWWWGLFLFMQIGSRIASNAEGSASADEAGGVQTAEVFFALVMVATLVVWGAVLRQITREQHDRMYGRVTDPWRV